MDSVPLPRPSHLPASEGRGARFGPGPVLAVMPFTLVGRNGFEPVTSSVSGNAIERTCFRFLSLNCYLLYAGVHRSRRPSTAIVTQLLMSMSPATHRCEGHRVQQPAQTGDDRMQRPDRRGPSAMAGVVRPLRMPIDFCMFQNGHGA